MQHEKILFTRLAEPLLEGYAWGLGARNAEGPYDRPTLDRFAEEKLNAILVRDLSELNAREADAGFLDAVDAFVNSHTILEDLREFFVDLALLQIIASSDDDQFESPMWDEIEAKTIDRGTDLMNLLIYLRDCMDQTPIVKPDLDDFLHEFLLVDEDDFQEEMNIYEPVVSNQEMVDGPAKVLVEIGNEQEEEMAELFTPLMLSFKYGEDQPGKITSAILKGSRIPHVHAALYRLLSHAPDVLRQWWSRNDVGDNGIS